MATVHTSYVGLDIDAVVYNPNGFGATLTTANYSARRTVATWEADGRPTRMSSLQSHPCPWSCPSTWLEVSFDEKGNYLVTWGTSPGE